MKLELSKSILESISSRVNNDIFTFDDVENEYKLDNIQEKLYNRLYKNYQDLTPPQFDLDTFRFTYKILCQNSGVKKTPQKQLNKVKDRKIIYDATTDESFESRIVGSSVRDEEGKVTHYEFRILIRDKESFEGTLTLSEMQDIYVGYSNRGYNLSARKLSEKFPQYDLIQLKKILRAFQITKDCYPFAPHIAESKSKEELERMLLDLKLHSASKNADRDEVQDKNKYILELTKELNKYRDKETFVKDLLRIPVKYNTPITPLYSDANEYTNTLVIFLSDMHIGAYNPKYGFIQLEDYNKEEINRRLDKVYNFIINKLFDNLIICNLGDSVDSYKGETVRGHELPTTITPKEQSKMYLDVMLEFFNKLLDYVENSHIKYICIGDSNHDGDWGWLNNVVLSAKLKELNIESHISDLPIDKFDIGNNSILFMHGDIFFIFLI